MPYITIGYIEWWFDNSASSSHQQPEHYGCYPSGETRRTWLSDKIRPVKKQI